MIKSGKGKKGIKTVYLRTEAVVIKPRFGPNMNVLVRKVKKLEQPQTNTFFVILENVRVGWGPFHAPPP